MKIERLVLENYRGFEKLDLALHPRLNVLIGANGAGKSSILRILRAVMVDLVRRTQISESEWKGHFEEDTVRPFLRRGTAALDARVDLISDARSFEWSFHFEAGGSQRVSWSPEAPVDVGERPPLLLALAPNRFLETAAARIDTVHDPYEALDPRVSLFKGFLDWFRDMESRENEIRLSQPDSADYREPALQAVRRAVGRFLAALPGADFQRLRITRVGEHVPVSGLLVIEKAGLTLPLDHLSEGESTILLTIGEIAHRLAAANPEAADPLQAPGVVLIDGIELHLHPAWQRAALPALIDAFPNVQFVVTTHSPQVIGQVAGESIICLRDFAVVETPETFGKDSNSILEIIMGAPARDATIERA